MSRLAEIKRQYTREAIIKVAEELFSDRGYHNTQVMDIVKKVGMSAGTFYNHFKDKRDLFSHVSLQGFDELSVRMKKIRESTDIRDPVQRREMIASSFNTYFDFIESHRQQVLIHLRGSFGVDREIDINIWHFYQGLVHGLKEDLERWLKMGFIERIRPHALACAVVGMAMNLAHSYLIEDKISRQDGIETLMNTCNTLFDAHVTGKDANAVRLVDNMHQGG